MVQCHSGTLPNDREGISVSAFSMPGICTGVIGHDCLMFSCSTSARTSWAATRDFLEAILVVQLTDGELSPNNATCLWASVGATPSRHSHRRSSPVGFSKETISLEISGGHCSRKMVGGSSESSPMTTPPTPCWMCRQSRCSLATQPLGLCIASVVTLMPVGWFGCPVLPPARLRPGEG